MLTTLSSSSRPSIVRCLPGVPLAVGFALFVNGLELLVAFLQAYIFTMLTANFIGMSVHPAH